MVWMDKALRPLSQGHRPCDASIRHQSIEVGNPSCGRNAITCEASMLCCGPEGGGQHAVTNCIVFWYVLLPTDFVPSSITAEAHMEQQLISKDDVHALAIAMAGHLSVHSLLAAPRSPRAGAICTLVSAASGQHKVTQFGTWGHMSCNKGNGTYDQGERTFERRNL